MGPSGLVTGFPLPLYKEIVFVRRKFLLYTCITLLTSNIIFLRYEQLITADVHLVIFLHSFLFVCRRTTPFLSFQLIISLLIENTTVKREEKSNYCKEKTTSSVDL
jgi:hypothetical protein